MAQLPLSAHFWGPFLVYLRWQKQRRCTICPCHVFLRIFDLKEEKRNWQISTGCWGPISRRFNIKMARTFFLNLLLCAFKISGGVWLSWLIVSSAIFTIFTIFLYCFVASWCGSFIFSIPISCGANPFAVSIWLMSRKRGARLYFNPFLPPVQSEYIKIKVDPWSVILKGDVVPWSQNARKSGVVWPVTTLNRNPRVSIYPNAYEQNVVLWRAGSNAGRVISRTYGSKARAKNLFSVTLFFQAPLFLRAIRKPNRVMRFRLADYSWKKTTGHNLRPQPIPSFSLAFGAAEKNMNFKMSLEIWISKNPLVVTSASVWGSRIWGWIWGIFTPNTRQKY